jgi:hypothetical protein
VRETPSGLSYGTYLLAPRYKAEWCARLPGSRSVLFPQNFVGGSVGGRQPSWSDRVTSASAQGADEPCDSPAYRLATRRRRTVEALDPATRRKQAAVPCPAEASR